MITKAKRDRIVKQLFEAVRAVELLYEERVPLPQYVETDIRTAAQEVRDVAVDALEYQ